MAIKPINTTKLKGFVIWFVCAIFFTYEFLLRTVLGTFQHPVTYDLHLTTVSFAILSSTAYQLVYAFMQIPVAIIIQRTGLKRALLMAAVICSLGVILFSFSSGFYSAFVYRLLIGFGASFGFLCLLISVYEWLPQSKAAFYIGLSQFIGTLGPMLAAGPLDSLISESHLSWRVIHRYLGGIGVCLIIPIYFFVENNREFVSTFRILKRKQSVFKTLGTILTQTQPWVIAIFSGAMYFAIEYFSENAGKVYLHLNGYSNSFPAYLISLAWLVYALSCPLQGYISDRMGRRKPLMTFSAIAGILSILLIIYFPVNRYYLYLAFICLGIASSGQSIGFAIIAEQVNKQNISIALGLNNAVIGLMVAFNAPLIGALLLWLNQTQGDLIYHYQLAFIVLIVLLLVALFITLFIMKETFCKSLKDPYTLTVKR